jgi:8-oxo-dGTP pyrophosphatase MutT (NUDIX family)
MQSNQAPGTFINAGVKSFNPDTQNYETPAIGKFVKLEKFRQSAKFNVDSVTPIAISPFGQLGKAKGGFGYMLANITYRGVLNPLTSEPIPVPGLALIRGDSVAMLTFLHCNGVDYVVLTEQARAPIGETNYVEIPAGMSDAAEGKAGYAAAIAEELEEEVGLNLDRKTEFVDLGHMIPSAGGCDERIKLYFSRVHCSKEALAYLDGKCGGVLSENEVVKELGGQVIYTSTNQAGNFKIGDGVVINQLTGTISGRAYSQSVLNTVTPLFIALG